MPRVRAPVPAEICRVVSQATGAILAPQNEFGVKFVCTTVRPTLLPFDQLYEARPLAKFVANFFSMNRWRRRTPSPVYSRPTKL